MSHPLDGVRAKVERAKEHFEYLAVRVDEFLAMEPYGYTVAADPRTGDNVVVATVKDRPPLVWGVIIGDVVHNLRSSLDHLVYQLIVLNGDTPDRRSEFPIFSSVKEYEASGEAKVKKVAPAAQKIIKKLVPDPTKGSVDDHPLWLIHELNRLDKHQVLTVVGGAVATPRTQIGGTGVIRRLIGGGPPRCPLEDGTELLRYSLLGVDVEVDFEFYVAFEDGGPARCKRVIPTLQGAIGFLEKELIPQFEPFF